MISSLSDPFCSEAVLIHLSNREIHKFAELSARGQTLSGKGLYHRFIIAQMFTMKFWINQIKTVSKIQIPNKNSKGSISFTYSLKTQSFFMDVEKKS